MEEKDYKVMYEFKDLQYQLLEAKMENLDLKHELQAAQERIKELEKVEAENKSIKAEFARFKTQVAFNSIDDSEKAAKEIKNKKTKK